jgi:hypothetical protein
MRFCEYGHVDKKGEFHCECGDRATVILDARNSIETSIQDAREFNGYRRPVYEACQISQGESLLRSNPITDVIKLQEES